MHVLVQVSAHKFKIKLIFSEMNGNTKAAPENSMEIYAVST